MMKRAFNQLLAVLGCSVAVASTAWAQDPNAAPAPAPWITTISTEVRYFSWQSNRGFPASTDERGSGSQIYTPYAVEIAGPLGDQWRLSMLGRAGYVSAAQRTAGQAGEVNLPTDTVTSSTLTFLGFNGIQPFVSVLLNLPTGRSALFGSAANARMDSDLVEIGSFGEGFNIGPTVGFNLPVNSALILTSSVGFTKRGKFERETAIADPTVQAATQLAPGEVLTFTQAIGYQSGQLTASLLGTVSTETVTRQAGIEVVQPGLRYLLAGTLGYSWSGTIGQTTLNASLAHSGRNKVRLNGVPELIVEEFNSNSNLYRVGLQHMFPVGRMAIGPTASFLLRDANGYDSTTFQFLPAKQRWAAGAAASYAVGDAVTLSAKVERVWTHEDEKPAVGDQVFSVLLNDFVAASSVPVVSSTGWQASLGLNAKF
jgi:hypothetical protein